MIIAILILFALFAQEGPTKMRTFILAIALVVGAGATQLAEAQEVDPVERALERAAENNRRMLETAERQRQERAERETERQAELERSRVQLELEQARREKEALEIEAEKRKLGLDP